MPLPAIIRRRSKLHGFGVFAAEPINKNTRIIDYAGELVRNHACRPNCWFEIDGRTIWIRASRRIRAGEELTYDYATVGERTIPCRCRPGCPNKL